MLGLKDSCLHPSSQKPYIKASSGGIDNSIEGIQVSQSLRGTRRNSFIQCLYTGTDFLGRTVSHTPLSLNSRIRKIGTTTSKKTLLIRNSSKVLMVLSKRRRLLILQTGCFDEVDFQGCHISQQANQHTYPLQKSINYDSLFWYSLMPWRWPLYGSHSP